MARQIVNLGSSPNKGDGDPLRVAFDKINDNFEELYAASSAGDFINTDVFGSVYSDDSTLIVDSVNGIFYGNLVGDVIGSVFADDSTIIIDSETGTIPGYVSVNELKNIVAQSTDFNDFKARISNL
jgi:hypothetical protein